MDKVKYKLVDKMERKSLLRSFLNQRLSALLIEGLIMAVLIVGAGHLLTPAAMNDADLATIKSLEMQIAANNETLANQPQFDMDSLQGKAWQDMVNENFESAIARYDILLDLEPSDVYALNSRAIAYYELGDYAAAIADYTQAMDIAPGFRAPYLNRGIAYENMGNLSAAAMDYFGWIRINGQEIVDMASLTSGETVSLEMAEGRVYRFPITGEAGQLAVIQANGVPTQAVDPMILILDSSGTPLVGTDDFGDIWDSLLTGFTLPTDGTYTLLVHHAGGGSFGTVELTLDMSPQVAMQDTNGLLADAFDNLRNEDYPGALAIYTGILELDPDYIPALNNRGIAYLELNRHEEAIADFAHAMEVNSEYAAPHLNHAIASERSGDNDTAAESYWVWINENGTEFANLPLLESGDTVAVEMERGMVYHFPFEATAGEIVTFTANSVPAEAVDPMMLILDVDGEPLIGTDDIGDSLHSKIEDFSLPSTGTYTLVLHHAGGNPSGTVAVMMQLSGDAPSSSDHASLTSNHELGGPCPSSLGR